MDMWNAPNGAVKTAFDIQVNGKRGPGRAQDDLEAADREDRREWKLSAIDPHDRDTWRSGVRICHACSKPVAWKGAHCCGYGPLYLHVNQKSDDDDV